MPVAGRDRFHDQRGRAVFLVLVAIVLFAALAYVVTQATPGAHANAGMLDLRTAQRIAAYPDAVQLAVKNMLADGVDVTALDFRPDGTGRGAVFSATTGVVYRSPAMALGNKTEWSFKGIGAEGHGFFVAGVGTDGPSGKDVIAYLDHVPKAMCEDINQALGLKPEPLAENPPVDLTSKGGGAKDGAGKNAYSFKAYAADPKPGACVQNGDKYVYYHVIAAQ